MRAAVFSLKSTKLGLEPIMSETYANKDYILKGSLQLEDALTKWRADIQKMR